MKQVPIHEETQTQPNQHVNCFVKFVVLLKNCLVVSMAYTLPIFEDVPCRCVSKSNLSFARQRSQSSKVVAVSTHPKILVNDDHRVRRSVEKSKAKCKPLAVFAQS